MNLDYYRPIHLLFSKKRCIHPNRMVLYRYLSCIAGIPESLECLRKRILSLSPLVFMNPLISSYVF